MFTYLFIWPLLYFSTNGNDAKDSFFDGSFKLAYHIVSTDQMEIKVLMPIKFKWLLAGFHNIPYLSSPQEDLFWLGIKKENNSIKPILQSCQLQVNDELKCKKKSSLYIFEKKAKNNDVYYFIIKRSPEGLQYGSEITFVWAFGTQESVETPPFVIRLHTLDVILKLKNVFQLDNNEEQISTLQPLFKEDDMTKAPNDEAMTTSLSNKSIDFNTSIHYKPQNSGENLSLELKETDNPITILLNVNEMDSFAEQSIVTPSFTFSMCNCSSCNCSSSFYWLAILHSKENSVYIAILCASALLTGLIVLFIVCTCSIKSPKQIKKTLDFYKIDELESDDDDEEVYFIKN